MFWLFSCRLDELPDCVLVIILELNLDELLQPLNWVCKRFYAFIKTSPSLCSHFEFDYQINLNATSLYLLSSARVKLGSIIDCECVSLKQLMLFLLWLTTTSSASEKHVSFNYSIWLVCNVITAFYNWVELGSPHHWLVSAGHWQWPIRHHEASDSCTLGLPIFRLKPRLCVLLRAVDSNKCVLLSGRGGCRTRTDSSIGTRSFYRPFASYIRVS